MNSSPEKSPAPKFTRRSRGTSWYRIAVIASAFVACCMVLAGDYSLRAQESGGAAAPPGASSDAAGPPGMSGPEGMSGMPGMGGATAAPSVAATAPSEDDLKEMKTLKQMPETVRPAGIRNWNGQPMEFITVTGTDPRPQVRGMRHDQEGAPVPFQAVMPAGFLDPIPAGKPGTAGFGLHGNFRHPDGWQQVFDIWSETSTSQGEQELEEERAAKAAGYEAGSRYIRRHWHPEPSVAQALVEESQGSLPEEEQARDAAASVGSSEGRGISPHSAITSPRSRGISVIGSMSRQTGDSGISYRGTSYRSSNSGPKTVYVHGYTRRNGTYVRPYTRRAPRG